MALFVLRRLGTAIPVVFGITLIAFILVHVVPGDPAKVILYGANASPEQIATLRQQLGLDDPLWRQYADFAANLLHGNLGTSFLTQNSVAHELLSRAPSTLILTAASMLVAVLVGVPLGLVAGCGRDRCWTRWRGGSRSPGSRCRTSFWRSCWCCCSA